MGENISFTNMSKKSNITVVASFVQTKEKIICRLINAKNNEKLLRNVPHVRYLDLAAVFEIVSLDKCGNIELSIGIDNPMIHRWHVDMEDFYQLSIKNTSKILSYTFDNVPEFMRTLFISRQVEIYEQIFHKEIAKEYLEGLKETFDIESSIKHNINPKDCLDECYILSNNIKYWGASVMLYEETMNYVREYIREDFYIVPFTQHGVLIIPDSVAKKQELSAKEMSLMTVKIHRLWHSPERMLSTRIYRYNSKRKNVGFAELLQDF